MRKIVKKIQPVRIFAKSTTTSFSIKENTKPKAPNLKAMNPQSPLAQEQDFANNNTSKNKINKGRHMKFSKTSLVTAFALISSMSMGCGNTGDSDGSNGSAPTAPPKGPVEQFIDDAPPLSTGSKQDLEQAVKFSTPSTALPYFIGPFTLASILASDEAVTCPKIVDSSSGATIDIVMTGDCEYEGDPADPSDNIQWVGSASIFGSEEVATIEMDSFGFKTVTECNGASSEGIYLVDGSLKQNTLSETQITGELLNLLTISSPNSVTCVKEELKVATDLRFEAFLSDFDGSDYTVTTYDSSGSFAANTLGSWSADGVALRESSVDEVSDGSGDSCAEFLDGTTKLKAGDDTVVVKHDGANQCTVDACAYWTLNDTQQANELCNVGGGCHLLPGAKTNASPWGFLLVLGAGMLIYRRRSIQMS